MSQIAVADRPIEMTPSLEARNVTRKFGDFVALDGVDLYVNPGEIVGILGPNGAGKSTFLRACEGLEPLDKGRVLILGRDLQVDRHASKGKIGLVLQRPKFSGYATVGETIDLFQSFRPSRIPTAVLIDALGLGARLHSRIAKLSGGERQRLAVLVGMMSAHEVILLDEPTSELDPQARRVVWRLISQVAREFNSAVLMTTHQMDEAELLCDRVYIVDYGKVIASGTPSQVILAHCDTISVQFTIQESAAATISGVAQLESSRHGQYLKISQTVATVEEGQAVMRSLIDRHARDIVEISLQRSNLEGVFIELTGSHLRR